MIPKYSVIIPHHNSQDSLIECINSIPCAPTYQVIVVDDCSDSEKVDFDVVKKRVNKSIDLEVLSKNQGAGVARNVGLKLAKGEWLLFADADDYFMPDMGSLLEQATSNTNADIIFFNVDSTGNDSLQGIRYKKYVDEYDGSEEKTLNLKYRSWAPWAKLFRKAYIDSQQFFFEPRKKGNDCFFVLNATANTERIDVVKEPLYHISYSPLSLSHTHTANWEYMFDVYDLWVWRYRFFHDYNIILWKEYNILGLLREIKATFGVRKCLRFFFYSFKYRYNYIEFALSRVRR